MKTKLLLIVCLLFSLQFFGQGFSGFKIRKEPTKETITKVDSTKVIVKSHVSHTLTGDSIINTTTESSTKSHTVVKKEKIDSYKGAYFFPDSAEVSHVYKILYGDSKFLNQAGVTLGSDNGAIYTEAFTGRFLKYLRLSLGAMLSNSNSDTKEQQQADEAYQRLVSYGGNTVMNIEYPWLLYRNDGYKFNMLSRLFLKGTADIPALGTTTEDWAGSGSFGMNFYMDATAIDLGSSDKPDDDGELKVFIDGNGSFIMGTDLYKENLGISNSNFLFVQFTAGFVYKSFKFSIIFATLSSEPELRKNKSIFGVQGVK